MLYVLITIPNDESRLKSWRKDDFFCVFIFANDLAIEKFTLNDGLKNNLKLMNKTMPTLIFLLTISYLAASAQQPEGWIWLFDGTNTTSWRGIQKEYMPKKGWKIHEGALVVNGPDSGGRGGDIITKRKYGNFDLRFEFKLSKGANGGLKYFVKKYPSGKVLGCEYQLIDDDNNQDIIYDRDGKRKTGALYALFEASKKRLLPAGQWNQGRIVVRGKHVEHWLNGIKILEYDRGGTSFLQAKKESKFKDVADFGEIPEGYILLQDHGDQMAFRNIRIKVLP